METINSALILFKLKVLYPRAFVCIIATYMYIDTKSSSVPGIDVCVALLYDHTSYGIGIRKSVDKQGGRYALASLSAPPYSDTTILYFCYHVLLVMGETVIIQGAVSHPDAERSALVAACASILLRVGGTG
jgi:hypothetical protein